MMVVVIQVAVAGRRIGIVRRIPAAVHHPQSVLAPLFQRIEVRGQGLRLGRQQVAAAA